MKVTSTMYLSAMKYGFTLILLVWFSACAVVPQYALYQHEYFPEGVNDIYLGMTYKFMEKTRETTVLEPMESTDSTVLVFREVRPGSPFESLTYYFENTSGNQLLYEFSVDFPEGVDSYDEAIKIYGGSNSDEGEWLFDTPEGFKINMWVADQKIFISAREIRNTN